MVLAAMAESTVDDQHFPMRLLVASRTQDYLATLRRVRNNERRALDMGLPPAVGRKATVNVRITVAEAGPDVTKRNATGVRDGPLPLTAVAIRR